MNKKIISIILIILIIAVAIGYFIINKINENNRNYEIEKILEYKYFVLKADDKYGVIDNTGKTIINATYSKVEIPNPSKDVFICYNGENGTAYNSNEQQLFREYNSVEAVELKNIAYDLPYEKSTLKCEKNGKYGLIDFSENKILDTVYDNIESFSNIEGQLQVEKDGKQGVVNIKGATLVKPDYDTVISDEYYSEENGYKDAGYVVGNKSENGYKYGYITSNGKSELKMEYNDISRVTEISDSNDIYLITAKNGQYGVTKNGKTIINNEYQAIEYDNTNKIFILEKSKNYGVADLNGKIVIDVENTSVQSNGQYIYVEKDDSKEVYDAIGNKVDLDFDKTILPTSNKNYRIVILSEETGNYYGVLNEDNKQIIKSEYLYIEYAFENYFIACSQNGKLGILDSEGNDVIDFKYDLVQKVKNKNIIQTLLAETNTTELYSSEMKNICTMQNATLESQDDYIKVYSNTEISYYNNNGEQIPASQVFPQHKLFAASKDGKWGYVDAGGNVIVDYKYDQATEFNSYGYASVKQDGKWGCIDSDGKVIVEPTYEVGEGYGEVSFIGEYLKAQSGFGNEYYTKDV